MTAPPMSGVYDAYVLCTAPRSGSTLLCRLLKATGVAGRPGSHFHEPSLAAWIDAYRLTIEPSDEIAALSAVFSAAAVKGTCASGMFGLRLQRRSAAFFFEKLAVLHPGLDGDVARLEAAFGRVAFLYLRRPDKLSQAVSFEIARQSGLWHRAPDGTEIERLAPPRSPRYDRDALQAVVDQMRGYDAAWETWFAEAGVSPLRLSYDGLARDPIATLRATLGALGRPAAAADGVAVDLAKLADELNDEWIRRAGSDGVA